MIDRYFVEREAHLRALGLDPDDDDTWAQPDSKIAPPLDADIDYHPRVDHGMKVRCVSCLSNVRQDGDLRCEPCGFKHRRRLRCAARALDV